MNRSRVLSTLAVIMICLAALFDIQITYDRVRLEHIRSLAISTNEFIEPNPLAPETLAKVSFGMTNAIADVLWLETIQYYGGGDPKDRYRKLPALMKTINALDPKFTYPYSFAGLVLPNEGFVDEALSILTDGEKIQPSNWEIPYSEGTIYFINKKDHAKAAEAYARAAKIPGAPDIAAFLSAVQFDRKGDRATAMKIFQSLADSSSVDYFKQRAGAFVTHYQLLDAMQNVVNAFKDREKHAPASLDELVQKRYIQAIPEDPVNRKIVYDPQTGLVSDENLK